MVLWQQKKDITVKIRNITQTYATYSYNNHKHSQIQEMNNIVIGKVVVSVQEQ